jgi:hypothetical protein
MGMEQEDEKPNGAQEKDTPDSATGANWRDETKRLVRGEADDASRILGPHWVEGKGKNKLVVRASAWGNGSEHILARNYRSADDDGD